MNTPLFNVFARSPLKPLQQHMTKVHECSLKLVDFFTAIKNTDWTQANSMYEAISILEKEADDLKKDIRIHLPKGLFLPVPRTDLLEMVTIQDRIANKAKDIAGIVTGRKMQVPAALQDNFSKFLKRSIDASEQANKAIQELDELLETGFQGREVDLVESMIHELNTIEHDTDEIQVEVRQSLFNLENELPPIDAIFLYKVIDWIGDLADRAQQVGGRLQILLAR